jgi:uridine kinase
MHHIRAAAEVQIRVLIVIHGYGSSGRGGSIRRTVREALENNFFSDRVDEYYHGEDLAHRSELYQALIKRRPTLKQHLKQLKEGNAGMTLLIMRH